MRLPSVRAAWDGAQRTLARFPFVMLSASVATASGWNLVGKHAQDSPWNAMLAASSLGLPLFTAVAVAAERAGSRALSVALHSLAIGTLIGFGCAWHGWSPAMQAHRYGQLSLGFHLLVAFLGYVRAHEPNGFWQFNRILFLRFCLSAVYSGVLFLGLVVALMAIDQLFKIRVAGTVYFRLWIAIAFLFNTWFFLSGVPRDLPELEQRRDYPSGLKVFTQFILIPLVAVYLAILTAYLGRIVITGQWPSGWIGWLVSSVATVGILSLLLVHPIREREENRWVSSYGRWFYVALLPAIGMLLVAIGKRIQQYGITEDRYFVAILSLWLAGIAATFIVRRNTGIRIIPITLCVLAFVTAFGPLGAYAVSRQSQLSRLRSLLAAVHRSPSGGTSTARVLVPTATQREISAVLDYLIQTHGLRSLRGTLGDEVLAGAGTLMKGPVTYDKNRQMTHDVMDKLGLDYVPDWPRADSLQVSYFSPQGAPEVHSVSGVDYHVRLSGAMPQSFAIGDDQWQLGLVGRGHVLRLAGGKGIALEFPSDTLLAIPRRRQTENRPRLEARSDRARATLRLSSYVGRNDRDTLSLMNIEGDLYLTLEPTTPR